MKFEKLLDSNYKILIYINTTQIFCINNFFFPVNIYSIYSIESRLSREKMKILVPSVALSL